MFLTKFFKDVCKKYSIDFYIKLKIFFKVNCGNLGQSVIRDKS